MKDKVMHGKSLETHLHDQCDLAERTLQGMPWAGECIDSLIQLSESILHALGRLFSPPPAEHGALVPIYFLSSNSFLKAIIVEFHGFALDSGPLVRRGIECLLLFLSCIDDPKLEKAWFFSVRCKEWSEDRGTIEEERLKILKKHGLTEEEIRKYDKYLRREIGTKQDFVRLRDLVEKGQSLSLLDDLQAVHDLCSAFSAHSNKATCGQIWNSENSVHSFFHFPELSQEELSKLIYPTALIWHKTDELVSTVCSERLKDFQVPSGELE